MSFSLRSRLILLFGALILLMALGEWFLVQSLTKTYEQQSQQVAFSVGQSFMTVFGSEAAPPNSESKPFQSTVFYLPQETIVLDPQSQRLPAIWQGQFAKKLHGKQFHGRQYNLSKEPHLALSFRTHRQYKLFEKPKDSRSQTAKKTDLEEVVIVRKHEQPKWPTPVVVKEALKIKSPKAPAQKPGQAVYAKLALANPRPQRSISWLPTTPANDFDFDVDFDQTANTLRIPIPSRGLISARQDFQSRWLTGSLLILFLGLIAAVTVSHQISKPLRELADAARAVGEGKLGTQVQPPRDQDISATIKAFNQMSHDLSKLQDETQRLKDQQHLTEIGEMSRGLAHTLRNPLNILGLCVEELGEQAGADSQDLVHAARDQIERMDRSLRALLALSSGQKIETLSIDDVIRDVTLEISQGPRADVRFELDGPDDQACLPAVAPELRAVLHAILVNAAEASPNKGEVQVHWRKHEQRLLLSVKDQGPGLPEHVQAKLFTPGLSTKEQGTGMGLFLAERIARNRYRGRLELENSANGGCQVSLEMAPRNELPHG